LPEVANDNRWQFDSANDVLRPVNTALPALVAAKPGLSQGFFYKDSYLNVFSATVFSGDF